VAAHLDALPVLDRDQLAAGERADFAQDVLADLPAAAVLAG
jgi:hypothetical protein